jgi:hypothetical protein
MKLFVDRGPGIDQDSSPVDSHASVLADGEADS